jgi:hypothetical protein
MMINNKKNIMLQKIRLLIIIQRVKIMINTIITINKISITKKNHLIMLNKNFLIINIKVNIKT